MSVQSQNPKDSEAAIAAFARKVLRRLHALGARSHTVEDVEQELWIAWCKACESWEATGGTKFSTYLYTGMQRHINRYVEKNFTRFHGQTIALSLDANPGNAEAEESITLADVIADDRDGIDVSYERESNYAFAMSKLSPRAQQFITFLRDQPLELGHELKRLEAKSEYARSRGITCVTPQRLASSIVLDFMGCSRSEKAKILAEVHEMGDRLSA